MNKLKKYLLYLKEQCGARCGGISSTGLASGGGCGIGYIRRGGSGVCTDYQDIEDVTKGYDGYQNQYQPNCMPDALYAKEDEDVLGSYTAPEEEDLPFLKHARINSPTKQIKLPEGGGEAGERKKISYDDLYEQELPDEPPEPVETPTANTQLPEGGEAGGDEAIPGMGEETPGMGGMEEVPQDPEYIGRIYELKKIYSRLVSIESFLDNESNPKLLRLRKYVSSTIELFQTLINNIQAYKDNIDDIIVLFYKFLLIVYTLLRKFYEQEEEEEEENEK